MEPFVPCALYEVSAVKRMAQANSLVAKAIEDLRRAITILEETPLDPDETGRPGWRAMLGEDNAMMATGMAKRLREIADLVTYLGRADAETWAADLAESKRG